MLEAARASLTRHVGGAANDVQRVLIERCARLQVFIEAMDARAFEAGTISERDGRQYLAWVNALRLALREVGLKAEPEKAVSITSLVARHNASAA